MLKQKKNSPQKIFTLTMRYTTTKGHDCRKVASERSLKKRRKDDSLRNFQVKSGVLLLCLFWKGQVAQGSFLSTTSTHHRRHIIEPPRPFCNYSNKQSSDEDDIVDAVIEGPDGNNKEDSSLASPSPGRGRRKRDILGDAFKRLTELSLLDYEWRSSLFKTNEADRRMEESLARMRGEDPSYVRPMDASDETIGPLGIAERNAVDWLKRVIEEEGKRAQRIVRSDGKIIRPIDSVSSSSEPGPLADLEEQAVQFINKIIEAEQKRAALGLKRPKDLDETMRGPLGEAEFRVMEKLEQIRSSEELRYQQTKLRKGEIVRPIDVPGPLGEIERAVGEVIRAEQLRSEERERNQGALVRPMQATVKGPLGDCEEEASRALKRLTDEERDRLKNVQRFLQEFLEDNRPMETNRKSLLGVAETIVVGIVRAPRLLASVADRVRELLQSENLETDDQIILEEKKYKLRLPSESKNGDGADGNEVGDFQ
jgi:hypothetical protein